MVRLKRSLILLLSLLSVAVIVMSCTSGSAPAAPTQAAPSGPAKAAEAAPTKAAPAAAATQPAALKDGVIKVGMSAALSGSASGFGIPYEQATRLVFDKFNEEGGVAIGDTRFKLQLIAYDDAYDTNRTVTNARKLLFDDRVSVFLPMGGGPTEAVAQLVNESKMLTLALAATKPRSEWPSIFLTYPTPDDLAQIYQWLAKAEPSIKKVATLSKTDVVGKWHTEASNLAAKAAGLEMVANEWNEPTATDFTPQLRKIIATGAQSISSAGNVPGQTGLIVKQARELGFTGKFHDTSGGDLAAISKIAGEKNFEGFIQSGAGFDQPVPKEWNDFISRYIAKYGLPFNPATINRTIGGAALTAALKGAKSLDGLKLAEFLEKNRFPTVLGEAYFVGSKMYGAKHMVTVPQPIVQYQNGVAKLVDWTKSMPEDK